MPARSCAEMRVFHNSLNSGLVNCFCFRSRVSAASPSFPLADVMPNSFAFCSTCSVRLENSSSTRCGIPASSQPFAVRSMR